MRDKTLKWFGAVTAALTILGGVVLFFPVVQTIAYGIIIQSPATLFWLVIGGMVVAGGLYRDSRIVIYGGVGVIVVMGVFVGPFMSGVYAQEHIVHNQQFDKQSELPETSNEHVRVLPRNVANQYAESANQLPRYKTGSPDIAYHNGSYTWAYGIVPDRLAVVILGNQWGAFYVDMEQTSRSVETRQTTMRNGMGMLFTDSYAYQMNLKKPLVEHKPSTAFVFEHNDETHIAQSYVTHTWRFRLLPVPQLYAVPEYGGTVIMDSDGNMEDLSPSEVSKSKRLEGQNTYPYDLARFRMSSMRLRNGLLNAIFIGEGVPQIADTGGFSDNKQPFTVPTKTDDGSPELTYFIAATPASSGDGIYQIYTLDSQTGEISYVQFNSTQAGPKKAAGYTRSQNRAPNWAANNEDGSTQVTEPIPLVIDNTLYWHMRVTPTDGARVSYTTFVNADTGNVYRASNTKAIYKFINGEEAQVVDEQNAQPKGVFEVVIINENGSVEDTITVSKNESVTVRPTNNTTTSGEV